MDDIDHAEQPRTAAGDYTVQLTVPGPAAFCQYVGVLYAEAVEKLARCSPRTLPQMPALSVRFTDVRHELVVTWVQIRARSSWQAVDKALAGLRRLLPDVASSLALCTAVRIVSYASEGDPTQPSRLASHEDAF